MTLTSLQSKMFRMYLRGSKWRLHKRRKQRRSNPALIIMLVFLIGAVLYFNQFVIPTLPTPLIPTPTATRDPESILTQSQEQFEAGNLYRTIDLIKEAILAGSTSSATWSKLARVQILAGEYEAAKTSARNSLLMNPDNPTALALHAWSLSFLGDLLEAERIVQQAIAVDPNSALAHAVYSEILVDSERYEEGGEQSRLALELDPSLLEVRRARGYVLELTGNYEEAIIEYNAALNVNDNIADLHLSLGRVYRALGQNNEAINEFNLANALDPTNPLPDTYIGRIYLLTGEYGKAVQTFEKAAEEDPSNPIRHGNLGTAYYRNLQYDDAITSLALAINGGFAPGGIEVRPILLSENLVEFYYLYGFALVIRLRCAEALPIFQAILTSINNITARENAEEGINNCAEIGANPPTPTPTIEVTELEPTATEEADEMDSP